MTIYQTRNYAQKVRETSILIYFKRFTLPNKTFALYMKKNQRRVFIIYDLWND